MKLALVYQAGIANVFRVSKFDCKPTGFRERLLQHAFSPCEWYCNGAKAAGAQVQTFACNMAGDITSQTWTKDLDSQPFSDKFKPV